MSSDRLSVVGDFADLHRLLRQQTLFIYLGSSVDLRNPQDFQMSLLHGVSFLDVELTSLPTPLMMAYSHEI